MRRTIRPLLQRPFWSLPISAPNPSGARREIFDSALLGRVNTDLHYLASVWPPSESGFIVRAQGPETAQELSGGAYLSLVSRFNLQVGQVNLSGHVGLVNEFHCWNGGLAWSTGN